MPDVREIESLIARVALSDRAAFEQLYEHTSAKLFGICLRLLNDRAEAEEVLQDVFVKVWRRAAAYQPSGYSPMSWLIAIARNQAIDRLRQRRPSESDIAIDEQIADDRPHPEREVVARDEIRQLDECLDQLDADKAAAVRGAYLDGDSYQLLADRFRVPLNTMRTWLRRSLIRLKECMEP